MKHRGPGRRAAPPRPPAEDVAAVRRLVRKLVDGYLAADPDRQAAGLADVRVLAGAEVIEKVGDDLARRIAAGTAAPAALAPFGQAAGAFLFTKFARTRNPTRQARLAAAAATLACGWPVSARIDLMNDLMVWTRRARSEEAGRALAAALACVRRSLEDPSGTAMA